MATCYHPEMTALNIKAFGGLLFVLLVMAALLFIPAWTLDYWQAWTFLAVYFSSSLAVTLYLMKRYPKLLARRMSCLHLDPHQCRRRFQLLMD